MASGAVTGGASSSAAGAMPASGAPLLGNTADLLQQLHQAQSLLKTADGAMQPAALQFRQPADKELHVSPAFNKVGQVDP